MMITILLAFGTLCFTSDRVVPMWNTAAHNETVTAISADQILRMQESWERERRSLNGFVPSTDSKLQTSKAKAEQLNSNERVQLRRAIEALPSASANAFLGGE